MPWTDVLAFAARPSVGATSRGVVISVDLTISQVRVQFSHEGVRNAALNPQDASEALRELVAFGSDAVRVECNVDAQHAVELFLTVNSEIMDACLCGEGFEAEEQTINLARNVWREARIPVRGSPCILHDTIRDTPCSGWNEEQFPLFAHQKKTVAWMRTLEARTPMPLTYAGNLRVTENWYLDTEAECFTREPSLREAHLVGGICADATGSGKTATTLRLIAETSLDSNTTRGHYAARGTLVILPLNLVSQWKAELCKFLPGNTLSVTWLVQAKDLRSLDMADLCNADVVFTTFHFLRACRGYVDMVDDALGGKPRTRAVLSSWARKPQHAEPVIEAVHWRRIVVDEIHQTLESARDIRQLRLMSACMLWGLTATPVLNTDEAQHLYLLLSREKAHHPNLLERIVSVAVRTHTKFDAAILPAPKLQLVQLSAEERLHLQTHEQDTPSPPTDDDETHVRDVVRLCTFVDVSESGNQSVVPRPSSSVEEQFRNARKRERTMLRARVDGHQRSVKILEATGEVLDREVQRLAELCAAGDDEYANAQAEVARATAEMHARDLARARHARDVECTKLERSDANDHYVGERLRALRAQQERCSLCGTRRCNAITPCTHLFCSVCIQEHVRRNARCPTCRNPLSSEELTGIAVVDGIGTKMTRIGELVLSLAEEPIILFVQWKSMVRGTRAFLRSIDVRVLLLDGNTMQRASTLSEFTTGGGVLLLCLEDCFTGLHLPHVHHIIFAHAIVANDRARVQRLEHQAIARCVRHGQTGTVQVYSFVVADCVEEDMWRRTHSAA